MQKAVTTAALFDRDGIMRGLSRGPSPLLDGETSVGEAAMLQVEDRTTQFARDFPEVTPTAIGLIGPGVVDDAEGIAILSADLRWANVPYKRLAERRLKLPSSFSSDARAAGEAEFQLGAARPYNNVVVLRLGERIASTLYVDGRMHGGGGFAGGLGHTIVDPNGRRCACGSHGCLQTVASTGAIVDCYAELSAEANVTIDEVFARARRGDQTASLVWATALDAVTLVISQIAAVLAPEAVVISGGLAATGDEFFLPLRHRVNALLSFHRRPALLPSMFDGNAALVGAALRARAIAA
ncbi:hypothetical protein JF66_09030 [Cryobacterium sp. MLB-32]|nr:hypothetical protein JF66_09030 [Cryobacterium sp. MLB-32]